jgi:23S rRNA pseudouridine1911/1915/1917 synthase
MQVDDTYFLLKIDDIHTGMRLDQFVAANCDCSRNMAGACIKNGDIRVNGEAQKPACKLSPGDTVSGHCPQTHPVPLHPEPIPLTILFEDEHLLIINKAPGIVTHPAPGHPDGTLVNGLLHHHPGIAAIGDPARPGIVHRLDRDTSGVMIVAKTDTAFEKLSAMFYNRELSKTYLAIVYGRLKETTGHICLPIGRHATKRKKMTPAGLNPRQAETFWQLRKIFSDASFLEINITTGRTHQIRVHCAAMNMPVVGDHVYGTKWTQKKKHFSRSAAFEILRAAPRQMLHAWRLALPHPITGHALTATAPLPGDLIAVLQKLRPLPPLP